MVERLRRSVARDLEMQYGLDYEETLTWLQQVSVFGNWTEWELQNRPVDLTELADLLTWDGWACPVHKTTIWRRENV